ncbi:N-acetylneuraminate synthase family protein [Azospirillum doebereinerae]|uniref:N-acylneuraminate-9-phosphate synthase n=1 Tax=Azospirillum doebereinerae TaxID=92933 RepID=A0A3S0V0G7_9PROT|nr:N-acetylneuraminate synthase family protein [Azospirillum doebereinerae]MCG5238920.1 N-acetylneuraminate synthase family protein [Azospirillum doebereinerae]RUQ68938.1 N-acylneuraminate-9-phosphate synthase [Azospirillum doebereinerae]
MRTVALGDKRVGPGQPVYVIAEIGGNFIRAEDGFRLIDLAIAAGVDAVKVQTFRAETLTTRSAIFDMENTGVVSQWELFRKFELSDATHREVFDYARSKGMFIFSTPTHSTDVDMLEGLGVLAHKIGSDDAVNIPLLKHVARTGKPVLLSTGMCTMSEVRRSVDAILEEGNDQLILFHCTTNYPTHAESVNLGAMVAMQREFRLPVGYSDHTLGTDVSYAAAVLGATILEFHFTHDKNAEGPDHMLSKDPAETAELVRKVRVLPTILGDGVKRPMATEMNTRRNNRKSLVLTADVKAGEKINPANMTIMRPGYGIPCEHYYSILGKTAGRDLKADDVLNWEDIF